VTCRSDIDKYACHQRRHGDDAAAAADDDAGGISAVLDCLQNVTRHGSRPTCYKSFTVNNVT